MSMRVVKSRKDHTALERDDARARILECTRTRIVADIDDASVLDDKRGCPWPSAIKRIDRAAAQDERAGCSGVRKRR